jgi:subtilisin-like proprotein convertase family protein
MKTTLCLTSLLLAMALPAGATLYQSGTLGGVAIPDNNTLGTGTGMTYTFTGLSGNTISGAVTLNFTLAGGYGGDLSGYLRLGNLTGSPSYNLTSLVNGSTTISGGGVNYSLDVNAGSVFTGQAANGQWTLFFADTSAVGATTVTSWSLDVNATPAVPEPVNVALGVFGLGFVVIGAVRSYRRSSQTKV